MNSGVPGLDEVLHGGLPEGRLYLLEGDPGAGKTTLGLQFLLAGAAAGERCLFVTLSETAEELQATADSHGWDLGGVEILDLQADARESEGHGQYTILHPAEVELGELTRKILARVRELLPSRLCFDSLSEVRLLARDSLRFRREVLAIKQVLAEFDCTAVLIDYPAEPTDFQLHSVVHGVLVLQHRTIEFGSDRRSLFLRKLRGREFQGGQHDYRIRRGGLEVFPRVVAAHTRAETAPEPYSSGIEGLDLLLGGGVGTGTCTMVLGPSGAGKSTLSATWALQAARRGEKAVVFLFDEAPSTWSARLRSLSLPPDEYLRDGRLVLEPVDPAEMSPGEFASLVTRHVDDGAKVVLIDSLNGYLNAMPSVDFLGLHLHELLHMLRHREVVTLLTMVQHGILGSDVRAPIDISYLADSVLLLRFFEAFGEVRKAVSVLKKRHGAHERTIRELKLSAAAGIEVGEQITAFEGVLGGNPRFIGGQLRAEPGEGRA